MLQEKPYNKDDDVIKATSFEVLSTLRDVLKTSSLWKDHVQTYIQVSHFFLNVNPILFGENSDIFYLFANLIYFLTLSKCLAF